MIDKWEQLHKKIRKILRVNYQIVCDNFTGHRLKIWINLITFAEKLGNPLSSSMIS
jgi:hypothetical protein